MLDALLRHGVRVALGELLLEVFFLLFFLFDLGDLVDNDHIEVDRLVFVALPLFHFPLHLLHFVLDLLLFGRVDVVDQVQQFALHFLVLIVEQLSQNLLVSLLAVELGLSPHKFRNVGRTHSL